uniref:Lipase_3 domain-containing protein n=1 Tax=Haemonchus contortus TaxID=6289 RepID=A0A7I4YTD3_HAECO
MLLVVSLLLPLAMAMPFDVVSESATQITYDDGFARNKMLPLAAAAYSNNPQQCLSNLSNSIPMKRLTSVICDITIVDKCTGYSAVSNDDKAIILSFRGSDRNTQLIAEGIETMQKNHTQWAAGGVVSKYFNDGFMRIWKNGMKDDLATLQSQHSGYELWITGHSLGGALASLAASYIAHNKLFPANKIKVVTFGQPRTGDKSYAAAVEKEVPYIFRITHAHDEVPHLPLENMEGYYHHKTEAFYNKGMAVGAHYYVCYDMGESTFCSDGNLLDTSTKDHLHYFEKDVSEYGLKGCK